ncbi:MAG TPA: hypothetical protein PLT08_16205 [Anaerolineales bacterium]|nr:hypothetical protein [Anaerolineales bacterium]
MKSYSKIIFYLTVSVLLISCGQPLALPTATPISILASPNTPKLTPTQEIAATATPPPYYSNILPTINPTELPSLLESAFSVETLDTLNGHRLRRVSGWDYGFNYTDEHVAPYFAYRYQWMDSHHLLLFPKIGEVQHPNWITEQKRAVVFNLDTGTTWLPPADEPREDNRVLNISLPYWSPTLGILITSQTMGGGYTTSQGVSIYNANGDFIDRYWGDLIGISPSGTKILIADDSWVDLETGRIVDFNWYFGDHPRWRPIWSQDETQIYMCCYFYGNATTGESYYLLNKDTIFEGKPIDFGKSLHHSHGVWLNDNYVLAQADGFYTFMSYFEGMIPVFDIQAKTFRDLIKLANLPYDSSDLDTQYAQKDISPKGDYMWIHKIYYPTGFLIDLKTFRSWEYAGNLSWVRNGEYAVVDSKLLVLSSKELKAMPTDIQCHNWHPTKGVCLLLTTNEPDTSTLNFLNVQDMSVQKTALSSPLFNQAIWSSNGDYIILTTEDKTLWRIDYPSLENMEQLTRPVADMYIESIIWSPDNEYLSFVGGTNIYIVDINKSQ